MVNKVYLGDAVYAQFDTVMQGDVTLTIEALLTMRQAAKESSNARP